GVRESFVGTNRSFVYSSAEGLDWNLTASFDDIVLRDIAWTGSNLVAVGGRSIDHGNAPLSAVMTSPDGVTWQEQPSDAPKELYSVVTGPGFIAAAGSGGYMITGSSTDNLSIDRSGATIKSVVYDGSGFVGVTNFGTVVTSTTGSNWEERHSLAATYFSGLAYSSDKYVALGGYNGEARSIYFSSDGTSWIQVWEPVAGEIFDLIRGGGQFVGVGEYGHVFLSDDGQNWDRVAAAGSIDLRTVAWSGSKYLALGDSTAHKSSDGTTWTNRRINVPDGSVIKQVTWAEGQFRGVGYRIPDSADGYYCFFSSADGYTWTTRKLKNDLIAPSDLVWTGARYMIFGRFGTLMTSANGEEWDILEAGTEAEFSGMAVSSRRLLVTGADRTVIRAER
ncbi:MAG: hypothetical protein GY867_03520, partial [bacterium]|nr:hypothetical protein [bacterium]